MKHIRTGLLIVPLLLTACGDREGQGDATPPAVDSTQAPAAIDLSAHDMPLLVSPPDAQLLGGQTPQVRWNEEAGILEVRAGEHFGLDIVEAEGDLTRVKATLDRDMLLKHEVVEEGPDHLMYRSSYPDQDLVFVHFVKVVRVAGRTFEVGDDPEGRFTEQDVRRMLAAVVPAPAG
ncbi:MAG TPA: hypothetical protein PKE21_01810 [Flavobacteriales bacterium]|nr:hypothetical protein [Flavobacteriales bacterium]HMR26189.1 hypothetical protein [Flavobacteriales bacterium]